MVVFKRKQVIVTIIFCMILAAGYINWAYQPGATDVQTGSEKNDDTTEYLGEAKMVNAPAENKTKSATQTKTNARNKAIELLREIINNPSADAESKKSATEQLAKMADDMENEGICEGILNTKGLGSAVVYINDGNAVVTLDCDKEITDDIVTKVTDVITSNSGISAENIKISKVK